MEGDEDNSLPQANKPYDTDEILETDEKGLTERWKQCEASEKLGESSVNVGGEGNGTVSLEDTAEGLAGVKDSELIHVTEMIEPPASDVAANEGGTGVTVSREGDPPLEMKVEEAAIGTDTGKVAVDYEMGDKVDELVVDPQLGRKAEEEADRGGVAVAVGSGISAGVDELSVEEFEPEVDGVVSDKGDVLQFSGLEMGGKGGDETVGAGDGVVGGELEADGDIGGGDEVGELVDSETVESDKEKVVEDDEHIEGVVGIQEPDGVEEEKVGGLITEEIPVTEDVEMVSEVNALAEQGQVCGEDVVANNSEVGTVQKPDGLEEGKGDPVTVEEATFVRTDVQMVTEMNTCVGDTREQGQFGEEDVVANDLEVGPADKPGGVEEEKVDPVIKEETTVSGIETDVEMATEVIKHALDAGDQEQVHELTGGVENVSADVGDDKAVTDEENLMSGAEMVEDENVREAVNDSKLDEPVNVVESRGDALVKEEPPAGDIEGGTKFRVGLESTGNNVVVETKLSDTEQETETEMGTEVVSDMKPDKNTKMETEETRSDVDEPVREDYDSADGLLDEEDEIMVAEEEIGTQDTEMETETDVAESGKSSGGKRKRGKLSKSPSILKATARGSSRKTVGEDVCFICFDGGELVLCDRRGCPKAYHPSCVNRDEAFFQSKGRWNCGWHLCSICEKNARYMCYTCTFSLCKSCTKDAVILCVRGNKGFCETCMKTVQLIENNEQGDKDAGINFDDRSSWEYLFKDYYIELKSKLSLSSDEIAEAKNPRKGVDLLSGPSKQESSEAQADVNDGGSGSENSEEHVENVRAKRRKVRKQSKSKAQEVTSTGVAAEKKATSLSDNSEWASKELLEFVAYMKNGDTSVVSQFDVQALLLEYIKTNNLRDPRRKSQIICDTRLTNLFGKPRVGHFEMLKLLESHFFVRDEQNGDVQGSVVDTENNLLDIDGNADPVTKSGKDKKRKTRKRSEPQYNLDDYAAIDMHNISLIYLRRKLMEDLLEEADTFQDKVVGTFVRIRISGTTQKQELYRLVQVVGTSKAPEPYKIGKKATDIMVEILNLDKTETIQIDTISNQEFTEEECKRLRQSIKCGLISRLTVGEILDKTTEIQTVRVNDWLESEILRLSHLRDRASDMGRRKDLRECVEKLQLLKTPEERRRRLEEIPEIHADPKMDPSYESDENDSETEGARRDAFMRSKGSGFSRRGRGPISPVTDSSVKDSWSSGGKAPSKSWEASRNNFSINASHIGEIENESSWNLERDIKDTQEPNNLEKLSSSNNPEPAGLSLRNVSRSESFTPVTPQASGVSETAVKINESEKMWHYRDPSGKVQGPFSMVQLRKWNNTGYFPADLKIWKSTESQENTIPLADALAGKFPKESPALNNMLDGSYSGEISGTSLHQDKDRSNTLPNEKWAGNEIANLPSPTPRQSNAAIQSPGLNGALQSPTTTVLQNMGIQPSALASVLNSVMQTGTAGYSSPTPNSVQTGSGVSPTPNPQQEMLMGPTDSLHTQSAMMSQQMHGQPLVQTVISQNPPPGQPQGYSWGTSNVQNPPGNLTTGIQSDHWIPPQGGTQPYMQSPVAPTASWGMGPPVPDNNASFGPRPENPNAVWGQVQANPNMGWGNMAPQNRNMGWGTAMQAPPAANATPGWVAPPANTGANIPGPGPGPGPNMNQGWAAPPVQGSVPRNGWVPQSGNPGRPGPVQGPPPQGNVNQGWGVPPGNQGPWGSEQNQGGGQFPEQVGGQGRDFNGGRPWNRQSSFDGGGHRKRDSICPYNANGRCKKGARCDYRHT